MTGHPSKQVQEVTFSRKIKKNPSSVNLQP